MSSRATIAEAACELFLERGYDATAVSDITSRSGVSRSTFFNYFVSKGDVFWSTFDERLAAAEAALADGARPDTALALIAAAGPDALALGIAHADAMGVSDELERERALRQLRLGAAVAVRLVGSGCAPARAEIVGAAWAAAVFGAVWRWALAPSRVPLGELLDAAFDEVPAG